jgi:hypothetical protein
VSALRITGTGQHQRVSIGCPFCNAPDWFECSRAELGGFMAAHYCLRCTRSSRLEFADGTVEVVLVAGPNPPPGMRMRVRRENEPRRPRSAGHLTTPGTPVRPTRRLGP